MAFRADEKAEEGREHAIQYLITRHLSADERERSENVLQTLIDKYGPVVERYPHWHPIMTAAGNDPADRVYPRSLPGHETGYEGLDHTIYLQNGFITCPYSGAERIMESVERLRGHPVASITAEELDVKFYMPNAVPVLVKCEWNRPLETDGTIPKRLAVPLLLEQELPCWWKFEVAETWETMRSYILGAPRGSRSSLFVNQETGQTLKNGYNTLIYTGMFGPIYVG